jgi:hypothetical protein
VKLGELETHPAADAFPLLRGVEFDELVADIKAKGLFEDVVLHKGKILDGRNRELACSAAGVEPRYRTRDDVDPIGYVVSVNLHRRHQNLDQRALSASKLAGMPRGRPRKSGKDAGVLTQREAAELLDVGERTVRVAGAVLKRAAPEVVSAVEEGLLSLAAAAELAKLPADEQREKLIASLEADTKRGRGAIVRRDVKPSNDEQPRDPGAVLLRAAQRALTQLGATVRRRGHELVIGYASAEWVLELRAGAERAA